MPSTRRLMDQLAVHVKLRLATPAPVERHDAPPGPSCPAGSRRGLVLDANVDAADTLAAGLAFIGHEVARRLRRLLPGIRRVALTGWGREHDLRLAQEVGFDFYRTKPVDLAELMVLIAAAHDR